ncbi:MAG: hypothetical protein KF845_12055 [Cyclobacteriaceae bacterium]|nr:hypothetical protein [Cyclobacteriaceae bacterium]
MKPNIAIYGAGGFGKEVRGMPETDSRFSFAGFFDNDAPECETESF